MDSSSDESSDFGDLDADVPNKRPKLATETHLEFFLFGDKQNFKQNLESSKLFFTDIEGSSKVEHGEQISKSAVWHDEDDEEIKISSGDSKQKINFERVSGGELSWARKAKEEEDSDEEDDISKSVGHLAKSGSSRGQLSKGELAFKRLTNVNKATMKEGQITEIEFHPQSTVAIVAGLKGLVSMFALDGKDNKKIHSIKYEKFPVYSCKLNTDGTELLLGGNDNYFHTYHLFSGHNQKSRLPKGINNLKSCQYSLCGKFLAVVGDYGEVHLLHALTKEVLHSFKQEHQSTQVRFSYDSDRIFSHSDDNEVTVFNIRKQRVEHKFIDDGCVNGTTLTISPDGKLLASGSRQGFVNIYNYDEVLSKRYPTPVKTISNINTEISDLKFNPSSEILALCSSETNNAVKMVHLASGTTFSNFPSQHDMMGKVTSMSFSPASGYFSFGTIGGIVPIYKLRHYNNY